MPRILTDAHKKALAEGRERAAAERAAAAAKSFKTFAKWSERDAILWASFNRGEISREQYKEQSGPMPAIISQEEAA